MLIGASILYHYRHELKAGNEIPRLETLSIASASTSGSILSGFLSHNVGFGEERQTHTVPCAV